MSGVVSGQQFLILDSVSCPPRYHPGSAVSTIAHNPMTSLLPCIQHVDMGSRKPALEDGAMYIGLL